MIYKRTIEKIILERTKFIPITLITGARQVGKSSLMSIFEERLNYSLTSLDKPKNEIEAKSNTETFLNHHKLPLIIDEVQKAPILFNELVSRVNEIRRKSKGNEANGMYILTGSQKYSLMKNVKESMAGRVSIIVMPPLSQCEIREWEEKPFEIDISKMFEKSENRELSKNDLYKSIIRGFYPELWKNENYDAKIFYDDYIETYLKKDVPDFIELKDKNKFIDFLKFLASITGKEFVPNNISIDLGITRSTIESWIAILQAGDIVRLLTPYYEDSVKKQISKRKKIFFNDTGLVCHLLGIENVEMFEKYINKGSVIETYIHNEIRKTYINNGINIDNKMFYYQDLQQNEIDLIILHNGGLNLIECKSTNKPRIDVIRNLKRFLNSKYSVVGQCVICLVDEPKKLAPDVYAFPVKCI